MTVDDIIDEWASIGDRDPVAYRIEGRRFWLNVRAATIRQEAGR